MLFDWTLDRLGYSLVVLLWSRLGKSTRAARLKPGPH